MATVLALDVSKKPFELYSRTIGLLGMKAQKRPRWIWAKGNIFSGFLGRW